MPESRDGDRQMVLCGELRDPASAGGRDVRVDPALAPETPAMLGLCHGGPLRPGLALHCADVRDLHDLTIRCATPGESLHLAVVLDGQVDVSYGPRRIGLDATRAEGA